MVAVIFTQGKYTIADIGATWCQASCGNWLSTVRNEFASLKGNPNIPVFYSSSCCGDCNGDTAVSIDEVIYGLNTILHSDPPLPGACPAMDANLDGLIGVSDLISAIGSAIAYPCPAP
jgi:hypothetical protein